MISEDRICPDCGKEFESHMYRGAWLARCPACADVAQMRPSICIERRILAGPFLCVVGRLPAWEKAETGQHDDNYCWKFVIHGCDFGVVYDGRIDVFSRRPYAEGDVVEMVEIEALHKKVVVQEARPTSPFTQLKGGPASISRTTTWRPLLHEAAPDGAEEIIETRRYVRLDEPEMKGEQLRYLPVLVYRVAHSKTTLKGRGRQYANELRGAPLWEKRCSGGCRSGRIHYEAALALVDHDHPLEVVNVFDA